MNYYFINFYIKGILMSTCREKEWERN